VKILSYVERDGMLVITTDFAPMPEFVYHADRFNNLADLKREMMKKAAEFTIHKQRRDVKKARVSTELDTEVRVVPRA